MPRVFCHAPRHRHHDRCTTHAQRPEGTAHPALPGPRYTTLGGSRRSRPCGRAGAGCSAPWEQKRSHMATRWRG